MAKSKRYEDSPEDMRKDKAAAKRKGVPLAKFENSAEDMAMDAAGQAALDKKTKKYAIGGKVARGMGAAQRGGSYC